MINQIPDYNICEDYVSKKSPPTRRNLEELTWSIIIQKINLYLSKKCSICECYFMFIHIHTKRAAKVQG